MTSFALKLLSFVCQTFLHGHITQLSLMHADDILHRFLFAFPSNSLNKKVSL